MHARRAITMMETVIGVLLVGGVLAATLSVVGPTARASQLAGDEMIASYLVTELIAEIEAQPYEDPTPAHRTQGPEPGALNGQRSAFDDVDDYHNWSAAPQSPSGGVTTGLTGSWTLDVQVAYVTVADPSVTSVSDTGVKRITVTAQRDATVLHRASILRTRSFDTNWGEE